MVVEKNGEIEEKKICHDGETTGRYMRSVGTSGYLCAARHPAGPKVIFIGTSGHCELLWDNENVRSEAANQRQDDIQFT